LKRYLTALSLLFLGVAFEAIFAMTLVLGPLPGPGKTDYLSYDYGLPYCEELLAAIIGIKLLYWGILCLVAPHSAGLFFTNQARRFCTR
jgi:hypothetical protein